VPLVATEPRTGIHSDSVSVIDAATNTVTTTIPDDKAPIGVAITPDGKKVYVANFTGSLGENGTVSVIDAATNTVTATVMVGPLPVAFGIFIRPSPRFAGTPGQSNCFGQSVSALAQQYHGLNAAAAALGYSSVKALQTAIMEFCEG
jgi:YVTN family beta-propeller protein